jgi:hypothetical protein
MLLSAWVATAAGCAAPAAAPLPLEPADFVLGGVPLDTDSAEIRLSFGEPDSVVSARHPYDASAELVTWYYEGLVIRYDGEPLPSSYLITGGAEATARGIRVNDPASLILQRYGEPDYRLDGIWTYLDPSADGQLHVLEFLVQDETVVRIHVGRVND